MKILDRILMVILYIFTVAAFLCLSVKYPLKVDTIDQYKHMCQNSTLTQVWVGFDGDIFKIKCSDNRTLKVPQEP
jgi:hypothetical protein